MLNRTGVGTRRYGPNEPYRVGAQTLWAARPLDIGAILAFAGPSGHVFRDPKMPTHWSPPEASLVGFGSCDQVAGGRPERRVPRFAHGRREASLSNLAFMLSMLANCKQGVTKIGTAFVLEPISFRSLGRVAHARVVLASEFPAT